MMSTAGFLGQVFPFRINLCSGASFALDTDDVSISSGDSEALNISRPGQLRADTIIQVTCTAQPHPTDTRHQQPVTKQIQV